jgi:hypothetical protein
MESQLNNVSIEVLLKYCKVLRPIWTLTWQHCNSPTMLSTSRPPDKDDVYYNTDIATKCLKEIGNSYLKPAYDYIKTEYSTLKNITYYIPDVGYTHRVYSSESHCIGYLLSLVRHQRRNNRLM